MPKATPTIGQKDWGNILNMHLSQIMNPATGGFNIASTDPTNLTAEDEGYTFINTTTGELKLFKGTGNGSSATDWQVLSKTGATNANPVTPASPSIGDTWFNTTTNELNIWNGTSWQPVGSGLDMAVSYENATNAEVDPIYSSLEQWQKRKVTYQSGDVRFFIMTEIFKAGTTDGMTKEIDGDGTTILKTFVKDKTTQEIIQY